MASIKQLSVGLIKRNAIKRGPTSSDAWNDSFEEVVNDLNTITSNWNNTLFPLLSGLPAGGVNDLDAFTNGLDGRTMYVDSSATSTVTDTTYYNTLEDRPRSIKEQFDNVYGRLTTIREELETEIVNASGGLTADQKTRIGANIFDAGSTSSSTSLDGKSELNRLNITQLGLDLYGDDFVLNNNGTANLLYSIKQQLGALLTLHNGTWNSDISVDHSGVGGAGDFLANGSVPMTGSFKAVSGTAGAPGITFASDTSYDTGFYLAAENSIGVAIGGVSKFTITASNDLVPTDGTLNVNGNLSVSSDVTADGFNSTGSSGGGNFISSDGLQLRSTSTARGGTAVAYLDAAVGSQIGWTFGVQDNWTDSADYVFTVADNMGTGSDVDMASAVHVFTVDGLGNTRTTGITRTDIIQALTADSAVAIKDGNGDEVVYLENVGGFQGIYAQSDYTKAALEFGTAGSGLLSLWTEYSQLDLDQNGSISLSTVNPVGEITLSASGVYIGTDTLLYMGGKEIHKPQAVTIPSSGDGNPASYILTPTRSTIRITNSDTDGADVTLSEAQSVDGERIVIMNVGSNNITIKHSANVCHLNGAADFTMGQYDTLTLEYVVDRWLEIARSNN